MAHFLGDQFGRVGVEHVGQRHHAALPHQQLDHVDRALGHAVREFLDGDGLGQHDLARDLFLLVLRAVALQPLRAAAEGGDRARALLFAAVAFVTVRRPRLRCSAPRVGRGVGTSTFCGMHRRQDAADTGTRRVSSSAGWRSDGDGGAAVGTAVGLSGRRDVRLSAAATAEGAGSPPARRRRASSSDCRLKSASWARRCSSSRLRASAASRSMRLARFALAADGGVGFLAAAVFFLSRARVQSARARASRCSAVRVGSTTPVLGGGGRAKRFVGAGAAQPGFGRRRRA